MLKLKKVHQDERGEVYILEGDLREHKEITILLTKQGFSRGGCIHRINNEFDVILEGNIRYFIGEESILVKKGNSVKIPVNIPHYFISLTDSIVIEWGCDPKEKIEKYSPFRNIVNNINKNNKNE